MIQRIRSEIPPDLTGNPEQTVAEKNIRDRVGASGPALKKVRRAAPVDGVHSATRWVACPGVVVVLSMDENELRPREITTPHADTGGAMGAR